MTNYFDKINEHRVLEDYLAKHRKLATENSALQLGIQYGHLGTSIIKTLEMLKKQANVFSGYESLVNGSASTKLLEEMKRRTLVLSGYDQLHNYSQVSSISNLKKMAGLDGLDVYFDAYHRNFAHMETQAIALGQLTLI